MSAFSEYKQAVRELGKAGLNAVFPNEFEYYMVTFEVVDSSDRVVEYLTFPVNPETMEYNDIPIINVSKTKGGVVVSTTSSFVPVKIRMTGTFGRSFKLILGGSSTNESFTSGSVINNAIIDIKNSQFNPKIKTGYGVNKMLENIFAKAVSLDEKNQPMRLFLYNPALGHNWLVVPTEGLTLSQNVSNSTAMWRYSIGLTAIAPLDRVSPKLDEGSLMTIASASIVQKSGSKLVGDLTRILR